MSVLSDIATHTRASSATYVDANGVLQTAAIDVPRVGHHLWNGSAWVDAGYFHESEARTNLITHSEDFTDASWSKTNTATLALDATGPFGVANSAVTLVDDGTSTSDTAVRISSSAFTVTTSTAYTFSMFCKADQLDWVFIRTNSFTSPADKGAYFDLATGVLGTEEAGVTGLIEDYGSGWYRCSITFTTDVADTSGNIRVFLADADNDTTVALDGTSSILIYGAQFEAGSTPSSYIPTDGSTVTRAADVMTIPAANLPWPTPEFIGSELVTNGTFDTDTDWTKDPLSSGVPWVISDGVASIDGTQTSFSDLLQGLPTEAGKVYAITFELTVTSGSIQVTARTAPWSSTPPQEFTSSGTYTIIRTASSAAAVTFRAVSGFDGSVDNVSVREINPLAMSIQMSGTTTYVDEDSLGQQTFFQWKEDNDTQIRANLGTNSTNTGVVRFRQEAAGVIDDVTSSNVYTPGINVPFNIASRHGSTFINGAVDGTALTINTTPTSLPDLSSTDMDIAPTFMGTIDLFRMWKVDITDAGIADAST